MTPEESDYWRRFWTSPDFRKRPYGWRPPAGQRNPYAKGYHRAQDLAYDGLPLNVPALRGGVVLFGHNGGTGYEIAIDVGNDEYDIYCHLHRPSFALEHGQVAYPGQIIARLARANEAPGREWTGEHLHFLVSDSRFGADASRGSDRDPIPVIDSVFSGLASVGSSPLPIPIPQTGDADMLLFNGVNNPTQYYLAIHDGRALKVRPTLGVEAKLLLGAEPRIPRGQLTDDEVVDLCAQGGYVFQDGVGYYDGIPSFYP